MLFFSEMNYRGNHAGTKARNDVECILRRHGARPVNSKVLQLREGRNDYIQSNIANRLGFIQFYWDLLWVRNETVIVQYPMLAFDIQYDYIKKLAKHNRVVFMIHDIQSLRREGHKGLEQEIEMLNLATGLIVHNRFMEQKLEQIGIRPKVFYRLNCFDYLCENCGQLDISADGIAFAGNLEKSEFIPAMCKNNPQIKFHFFGPGWIGGIENAEYHGSFTPEETPNRIRGKYGLIWDGKTTAGCTGAVGEYTRINNPHKMSLYIAAGIPVIAWNNAAIAEFIQKNGIGVTVDCIDHLQDMINGITDVQYAEMKENVLRIREQLLNGNYLQAVLAVIREGENE